MSKTLRNAIFTKAWYKGASALSLCTEGDANLAREMARDAFTLGRIAVNGHEGDTPREVERAREVLGNKANHA